MWVDHRARLRFVDFLHNITKKTPLVVGFDYFKHLTHLTNRFPNLLISSRSNWAYSLWEVCIISANRTCLAAVWHSDGCQQRFPFIAHTNRFAFETILGGITSKLPMITCVCYFRRARHAVFLPTANIHTSLAARAVYPTTNISAGIWSMRYQKRSYTAS